MLKNRYMTDSVLKDLFEKMVFIGGPRQVGKTTLSKDLIAKQFTVSYYYNWDNREDRKNILKPGWPAQADILIFDEIHKYKHWKSYVKGEYDKFKKHFNFIVTGSARLDVYRRGGDSMQGRYHYYRLHPFSIAESCEIKNTIIPFEELYIKNQSETEALLILDNFGGFPEPFIKQSSRTLRRWHNERVERLVREDIRDLTAIRDISGLNLLCDMLPERAGNLLSINSLREDLSVSHRAVTNWMNTLESMYYCYRIYPFHSNQYRSLKKEPKLYLWDWSEITDEGARFENLIASHLLKLVHFLKDHDGFKTELKYLRSSEKKEVDFLVTCNNKPWFAVEVKINNTTASPHLDYFNNKIKIPFLFQVVKKTDVDIITGNNIRIISADKFLLSLI